MDKKERTKAVAQFSAPIIGAGIYATYCAVFGADVSILFYVACFIFVNADPFRDDERADSPYAIAFLQADVFCRRIFLAIEIVLVIWDFLAPPEVKMNVFARLCLVAFASSCMLMTPFFVNRFLLNPDGDKK